MENNLAQQAVSLAIKGLWTEALVINLEILKEDPNDIDALNRIARCYSELGELKKARESAKKVLDIDPTNSIATRCLAKYKNMDGKNTKPADISSAESFLEESGKTKIIDLLNLGDKSVISCLNTAEVVKILPHSHKVSVVTGDNKYIGRLPDDVSARIRNLIKHGNRYQVLIKSISENNVVVFIRELENKTKDISFPTEKIDYVSYTPPELVHKEVEYTELES